MAVDDIDAAVERALAAGGSSRVPRHVTGTGFTLAYATDPEDTSSACSSRARKAEETRTR